MFKKSLKSKNNSNNNAISQNKIIINAECISNINYFEEDKIFQLDVSEKISCPKMVKDPNYVFDVEEKDIKNEDHAKNDTVVQPIQVFRNSKNDNCISFIDFIRSSIFQDWAQWLKYAPKTRKDYGEFLNEIETIKPWERIHNIKDIVPDYLLSDANQILKKSKPNISETISKLLKKAYAKSPKSTQRTVRCCIIGPSKCGKSTLTSQVLQHFDWPASTRKKAAWEAEKAGHPELATAWLSDTSVNDRQYLHTTAASIFELDVEGGTVRVADCAGSAAYFPETLCEVSRADCVVLVLGEWEEAEQRWKSAVQLEAWLRVVLRVLAGGSRVLLVVRNWKQTSAANALWQRFNKSSEASDVCVVDASKPEKLISAVWDTAVTAPVKEPWDQPLLLEVDSVEEQRKESAIPVMLITVLSGGINSSGPAARVTDSAGNEGAVRILRSEQSGGSAREAVFAGQSLEMTISAEWGSVLRRGCLLTHAGLSESLVVRSRVWRVSLVPTTPALFSASSSGSSAILPGEPLQLWCRTCSTFATVKPDPRHRRAINKPVTVELVCESIVSTVLDSPHKLNVFFLFSPRHQIIAAGKFLSAVSESDSTPL